MKITNLSFCRRFAAFVAVLSILCVSVFIAGCGSGGSGGSSNQARPSTLHELVIIIPGGIKLIFFADDVQGAGGVETGGVVYESGKARPTIVVTNTTGTPSLDVLKSFWPDDIASLRYTYTPIDGSSGRIELTGEDGEVWEDSSEPFVFYLDSIFNSADVVPVVFAVTFNSDGSTILDLTTGITFSQNNGTDQYVTSLQTDLRKVRDNSLVPYGYSGDDQLRPSILTDGKFDGGTITGNYADPVSGLNNTYSYHFTAGNSVPLGSDYDPENPRVEAGLVTMTRTVGVGTGTPIIEVFEATYSTTQPLGTDEAIVTLAYVSGTAVPLPLDGPLVLEFSDYISGGFITVDGRTGSFEYLP